MTSRPWNVADLVTITIPAEAAHLVYDELQARTEWLGSTDMDDIHRRVYEAIVLTLDALDVAGSGPSPLGTYGPVNVPDYVRESWTPREIPTGEDYHDDEDRP